MRDAGGYRSGLVAALCALALCAIVSPFASADRPQFGGRPVSFDPIDESNLRSGPCNDYRLTTEDGTSENAIGLLPGGNMAWANRFEAVAGCELITAVKVSFGDIPNGWPAQIYVLSDPNQDGHPGDSLTLATANVTVANAQSNAFNTYPIGPVSVSGRFFIAVRMQHDEGQFPANLDQTAPHSNVSWITFGMSNNNNPFSSAPSGNTSNLNQLSGLNGDWMLRAVSQSHPCSVPLPPCRSDVGGANNGPPDGQTNVTDLLIVINTWGQTGPQNGVRPKGDCHPLPNGDCTVNVGDLLAVINGWGTCPCEQRACCFPDGTCQFLCESPCTSSGGTWQAGGTTCGSVNCPTTPVNDECSGAIQISDGTTNVNNTGATTSTGVPGAECIFGGPGQFRRDIWFRYAASCTGNVTVSTCNTTGSVTDTVLQILSGECGNLTEVLCNDDGFCDGAPSPYLARATFTAAQGAQLYIRLGTWSDLAPGPITLTINCTPFNPDFCADAQPLTLATPYCGNLNSATPDNAPICNAVSAAKGIWHKITGTGTTLTASLCGSNQQQFYDARLSVYCGAGCDNLICVAAANNNTCNLFEQVTFCSAPGRTYWILVHTDDAGGEGQYCLQVTSGASCNNPVSCSVPGDECSTPIEIGSGPLTYVFNTAGATSNAANGNTCDPFNDSPAIYSDIWLRWTATQTGTVTFSTCASSGNFDNKMAIYSGISCPQSIGNMIACDDNTCVPFARFTAFVTTGQTYLIRLGSPFASPAQHGSGSLAISTATPPPANDECSGALVVNLGANPIGTNAGATTSQSIPGGNCGFANEPFTKDRWYKFTNTGASSYFKFTLCGAATSGDTMISVLSSSSGGSCPPVLPQLGCNDDFCDEVSEISITSAPIASGQTVFIRVGNWNNAPDYTNATLTISTTAAPPPFVCGISACALNENQPCRVDGDDPLTDPNGGCNSTGLPPGTAFAGPISVNQTVCGIVSTYYTNGNWRDTDWYLFTPTATGVYTLRKDSTYAGTLGFVTNGTNDVRTCGGSVGFVNGGGNVAAGQTSIFSFLQAGRTYAVFFAPAPTVVLDCPPPGQYNYCLRVTGP